MEYSASALQKTMHGNGMYETLRWKPIMPCSEAGACVCLRPCTQHAAAEREFPVMGIFSPISVVPVTWRRIERTASSSRQVIRLTVSQIMTSLLTSAYIHSDHSIINSDKHVLLVFFPIDHRRRPENNFRSVHDVIKYRNWPIVFRWRHFSDEVWYELQAYCALMWLTVHVHHAHAVWCYDWYDNCSMASTTEPSLH